MVGDEIRPRHGKVGAPDSQGAAPQSEDGLRLDQGGLKSTKIGGRRLITDRHIEEFLREHESTGIDPAVTARLSGIGRIGGKIGGPRLREKRRKQKQEKEAAGATA